MPWLTLDDPSQRGLQDNLKYKFILHVWNLFENLIINDVPHSYEGWYKTVKLFPK